MNLPLLEMLRARRGEWCRSREIANHLFITPVAVRDDAFELQRAGYPLDCRRGRYRFTGVYERLLPYEITRALGTAVIGKRVVCLETVGSTNDEAWRLFREGVLPLGGAVFAEAQSEGRGRFGRRWLCPRGTGVLMSVVLSPELDGSSSSILTVMGAVAATDALNEHFRVPALIAWPNDVIVKGRKLGGVLVEARRDPQRGRALILGMGLNVNVNQRDMPEEIRPLATSLRILTGKPVDRIAFIRALLRSLDRWYAEALHARHRVISQQWRQYSADLGERITVQHAGRRYRGRVLDLSVEEGLVLRLDHGGTRVFDAGEAGGVSVIRSQEFKTRN